MNGAHELEFRTAPRLTNLLYTDALPHLPLPQAPQPLSITANDTPPTAAAAYAQDPTFLELAASLLQSADLSYIEARGALPAAAAPCGPLHAALLAQHPAALDTVVHHVGPALPPLQKRHLTLAATPMQGADAGASPPSANAAQASPLASAEMEIDEGVTLPVRRKRSARKPARMAPIAFVAADEAGALHTAVAAFLDHGDPAPRSSQMNTQDSTHHTAKGLQLLAEAASRARAADAVSLVDAALLRRLLLALAACTKSAGHALVPMAGINDLDAVGTIFASMDATVTILGIASAEGVGRQAVPEEALDQACMLLRHHLLHNVLAFHDVRLQRLHRPTLASEDAAEMKAGSARKGQRGDAKPAANRMAQVPEAAHALQGRLGSALELLAQLLSGSAVAPTALIPLLRACAATLTVSHLRLLHVQAAGVLVAAFQHLPQHRGAIMEELVGGVLPYAFTARAVPRATALVPDAQPSIHIITSVLLQMLQACVALPAMDTAAEALRGCFSPAIFWADAFWNGQLDRLNANTGVKNEGDAQLKLWVERIVADLLAVLNCPEWPAAGMLLTRGVGIFNSSTGLASSSQPVRQMIVEQLGCIAKVLWADKEATDADVAWLAATSAQAGHMEEDPMSPRQQTALQLAQTMLLQHLSLGAQAGDANAGAAATFTVCRMFFEEVCSLQKLDAGEDALREALVAHRRLLDRLATGPATDLTTEDAVRLGRALVQDSLLGRGRSHILKWLLACIDASQQGATVRCKAVKALKAVVQASRQVLGLDEVQDGVSHALQDEAVSVREAAVDLLGCHIGSDPELATAYLDMLIQSSRDTGTSVRKRALSILWESCIRLPNFPRVTETCVAVLQRYADPEESVRELVAKVFQSLWFSPGAQPSNVERSAQLAEVAAAVYDKGVAAIRLPLDDDHPLVAVMSAAVRKEQGGKRSSIGAQLGQQLLEAVLAAHESCSNAPVLQAFPPLLALHALGLADPKLCMPSKDEAQFVRALAPYLKDETTGSKELKQRAAECLLCIMSLLSALLTRLDHVDKSLCDELERDLVSLIQRHLYSQVVQVACCTLAGLARHSTKAGESLARLAASYVDRLAGPSPRSVGNIQAAPGSILATLADSATPPAKLHAARANAMRTLFVLGQLARHGGRVIDAAAADESKTGPQPCTLEELMNVLIAFHGLPAGGEKVADAALQALGAVFITKPDFMLEPESKAVMHAALQPTAPPLLKIRALLNLTELLKAEEVQLLGQQARAAANATPEGGSLPEAASSAQEDPNAAVLATQNGLGESLGVSSGVLQDNWDLILALATDTAQPGAESAAAAQARVAQAGLVRRRARDLIDAVLRGGLVAPWTAVPALVALATDPQRDVGEAALRLLRQQAEKSPNVASYLQARLPDGIALAHTLHQRLAAAAPPAAPGSPVVRRSQGLPTEFTLGVASVYTQLVQPSKTARTLFTKALLRRFDAAASLSSTASDLPLLLTCAQAVAALPFGKADEPLATIVHANSIIAKRGEAVLSAFKAASKHTAAIGMAAPSPISAAANPVVGIDMINGSPAGEASAAAVAAQHNGSAAAGLPSTVPQDLTAACNASLAVSMLLLLKSYLLEAYSLASERVPLFATGSAERKKQDEKLAVSCDRKALNKLHRLRLDAAEDVRHLGEQFWLFKELWKSDSTDYVGCLQPAAEDAAAVSTPTANGTGGNRAAGSTGGAGGSKGRRTPASTLGRQRSTSRRKRQRQDDGSEDEGDGVYRPAG